MKADKYWGKSKVLQYFGMYKFVALISRERSSSNRGNYSLWVVVL